MRREVQNSEGNVVGTIDLDNGFLGQVAMPVVDAVYDHDTRFPFERHGSVTITVTLPQARLLAGKHVVLYVLEENSSNA